MNKNVYFLMFLLSLVIVNAGYYDDCKVQNGYDSCQRYVNVYQNAKAHAEIQMGSFKFLPNLNHTYNFIIGDSNLDILCRGDNFYIYENDFDFGDCNANGCRHYDLLLEDGVNQKIDMNKYIGEKVKFVCHDFSKDRTSGDYSWTELVQTYDLIDFKIKSVECEQHEDCNSDEYCVFKQEAKGNYPLISDCEKLNCDFNETVLQHECYDDRKDLKFINVPEPIKIGSEVSENSFNNFEMLNKPIDKNSFFDFVKRIIEKIKEIWRKL